MHLELWKIEEFIKEYLGPQEGCHFRVWLTVEFPSPSNQTRRLKQNVVVGPMNQWDQVYIL